MSDIRKMDSGFKINNLLLLESRSRLNHYTSSEFYCEPESLGRFILLQELRVAGFVGDVAYSIRGSGIEFDTNLQRCCVSYEAL